MVWIFDDKIEIQTLINFYFIRVLNQINRKLKTKQTFRKPYFYSAKEIIPHHLIGLTNSIIQDTEYPDGPIRDPEKQYPVIKTEIKRNHPDERKAFSNSHYKFTVTDKFSLVAVLVNLTGKSKDHVETMLKKKIKKCVVEILVTEEKPFVFSYVRSRDTLTFSGYFSVKNEYGVTTSF